MSEKRTVKAKQSAARAFEGNQDEFTPRYDVIPPAIHARFEREYNWIRRYALLGFGQLSLHDYQMIAHKLNIEKPTKQDLDRAAIYGMVLSEYTLEAVKEFYHRADTRLEGATVDIEGLYKIALAQVRSLYAQSFSLCPRSNIQKALAHLTRNQARELHLQNDVFYLLWLLNQMQSERDIYYEEAVAKNMFPVVETPERFRLYIRVQACTLLATRYVQFKGYKRVPEYSTINAVIKLARRQKFPWFVKNQQVLVPKGYRYKYLVLNREWLIGAGLWDGISYAEIKQKSEKKVANYWNGIKSQPIQ